MRIGDAAERLRLSRRRVLSLVDEGVLVRLSRSIIVGSCLMERSCRDAGMLQEIRIRRLLLEYDDAVASHESGAYLHRLPQLYPPRLAIATRARGAWRGGDWSRIRIAALPDHHVTTLDELAVTALARTVVDVARTTSMREAVVVGDAALRRGLTLSQLWAAVDQMRPWADLGRACDSLAFLDARAESALESVSRVILDEYDLEPPELQAWLEGADGLLYRVDFWWKKYGLIGEADGLIKYDADTEAAEKPALGGEKLRQEALEETGKRVVRWTMRQMPGQTDETIARISRRMT